MQNLPVSSVAPSVPAVTEGANGVAHVADEVLDGESFGQVLSNQIKATLDVQFTDASRLIEATSAEGVHEIPTRADALPLDLAALLANIAPVAVQVRPDAATRAETGSSAARQLDVSVFDKGKRISIELPDAEAISSAAVKDAMAAEIAETGKKVPLAGIKAASDLPLKDQAGLNPAQAVVTSRPDLPSAAAVHATNHATSNLTVEPRVGAPGWDGALGQKVVWLANQNHQTAEMHLNPPNLGPLEVKLTIANDQASAMFVSPHAAVRDAVESALPRLREMLAENGITLGNVNVSAESFTREQAFDNQDQTQGEAQRLVAGGVADSLDTQRSGVMYLPTRGLVDTFA